MSAQVLSTMVGDVVAGEANWGNEKEQQLKVFSSDIDKSTNIRVALRCRPPNKRELAGGEGGGVVVQVPGPDASSGIVAVDGTDPFSFDLAFPMNATQLEVFEAIGVDIVQCAFHGYNASLFAYGQTSSGKSFSMMGVTGSDLVGLIPRISRLLFGAANNSDKTLMVEASYLEIYNEKLRDLLDETTNGKGSKNTELKIRENKQLGVHVQGLKREVVKSSDDTLAIIDRGFKQRTTAATLYNAESSRSHAVFEINIRAKFKNIDSGEDMVSSSRIALIDLAGSERSDKLGSKGAALKEGNNINKSLTVLGRCIRALVDISKGKKVSVPFRESVLTWYLRDSLAGNARTTMLAACSPVESNKEETLSTLRYAASAKNIKTAAKKNEDPAQAKIRELSSELEKLKQRLEEMEKVGENGQVSSMDGSLINLNDMSSEEKHKLLFTLNEQMGVLQNDATFAKSDISNEMQLKEQEVDLVSDVSVVVPSGPSFPVLSCLNKDDMLSHAMTISLTTSKKNNTFTIGRTLDVSENEDNEDNENDFELNGMGIKSHHCQFIKHNVNQNEENNEDDNINMVVQPLSRGAHVYVNGVPLEQIGNGTFQHSKPLRHLDRIILGPGRLITLFLTKSLTLEEKNKWNYETCFNEMISVGSPDIKDLVSEDRRNILNLLTSVSMDQITQGNMMASEMGVPIRFEVDMVVKGQQGVLEPNVTFDRFLNLNDLSILIRCKADIHQKIITAHDLVKASFTFYEEHEKASLSSNRDFESLSSHNVGINTLTTNIIGQSYKELLFEISLNDFEDVLYNLKEVYTSLSTLTGGFMTTNTTTTTVNNGDASETIRGGEMGGNTESSRMIRNVFEALDKDKSGFIDGDELKKGLIIFQPDHDESLILETWKEENFNENISMNLNEFENFLIRFMQRQFYKCIEPMVTNRRVFSIIGGRDMYFMAKQSLFKLEEYENKFLKYLEEIEALKNEKNMILKQSQETSAKINFMELEAKKEKEHIGGKNMLAIGLVRANHLIGSDFHFLGAATSDPRVKFRFVTQEYVNFRLEATTIQKRASAIKSHFSKDKKWLAQSTVKKLTLNPVWNELYYFPTNLYAENKILEIKVEDWDFFGKNDFLGRAFIKLNDLPHDGNLIKMTIPLLDDHGKKDVDRGSIELALSWVHDDFKAVLEGRGGAGGADAGTPAVATPAVIEEEE